MFICNPETRPATDLTINFNSVQQTMVGFGGTDRNVGQLTDPQAAQFFDPSSGIGLSILFGGIEVGGGPSSFYSNMTKAASYGAKIIARPWSAPGIWKDNGTDNNGGHLLVAHYNDWASRLAAFQGLVQTNASVNLYAIGIQNEPDFSTAAYETMLYTTAEMVNFLNVLGPMIKALTPAPLIVAPETFNWDNSEAFGTAILADATAGSYLDAAGTHQYSGTPATVAAGKPTWQTEYSDLNSPFDASMSEALSLVAPKIHAALTTGNVSMWGWWELNGAGTDNEGLVGQNSDFTITKRFYVLGNWSKFVRPGWVRVATSGASAGTSVTAFRHPTSGACCMVVVNTSASPATFTVSLQNLKVTLMTPWVTDATNNLAAQFPASVSGSAFTASVGASSVTTFVGS